MISIFIRLWAIPTSLRGRLFTSKLPLTAVHILNEDVLTFFDQHDAVISTILSDNGRDFCGRLDKHPYEIFLQVEGIEHRTRGGNVR